MPSSVFGFRVLDRETFLLFVGVLIFQGAVRFTVLALEGHPKTIFACIATSGVGVTDGFRAILRFGMNLVFETASFGVENHVAAFVDSGTHQTAFVNVHLLDIHEFNPRLGFFGFFRMAVARVFFFRRGRDDATVVDTRFFVGAVILPNARFRTSVSAVATLVDIAAGGFVVHVRAIRYDRGRGLRATGRAMVVRFTFLFRRHRNDLLDAVSTAAIRALGRAFRRRLLLMRRLVLLRMMVFYLLGLAHVDVEFTTASVLIPARNREHRTDLHLHFFTVWARATANFLAVFGRGL